MGIAIRSDGGVTGVYTPKNVSSLSIAFIQLFLITRKQH